ncbi:condensation domain-containing protein [Streptosporangium sp. NPDC051023]|uniref:condensation domain-containing protein n=1 Tax=Streptosporangium sp. NPDC051023 TaxID=3155410 RepID=UPI00344D5655
MSAEHAKASPATGADHDADRLALSPAQQRLWFLQQFDPGSTQYNVCLGFEVRGALDVAALQRSLTEVVARHDALRTSFPAERGRPGIRIGPPGERMPLPYTDLSDETDVSACAAEFAAAQVARPFDLADGAPMRAHLLGLGPDLHILLLTLHHIVVDAWSVQIILAELGVLYSGHVRGEAVELPVPEAQYADYAAWQRGVLGGEHLEREFVYWGERLAGTPAVLDLPTDRPRSAARSLAGGELPSTVAPQVAERLHRLAAELRCTMFVTTLTAFMMLLARWTGTHDIVVAIPVAGRAKPEFQSTVGFFVNTVPLRGDLSGDPTFRQATALVGAATLEALEHDSIPFDMLVDHLEVPRNPACNPLAQVGFQLLRTPHRAGPVRWHDVEVGEWDGVRQQVTRLDLELHLLDTSAETLETLLCYRTDLFDLSSAEDFVFDYQAFLAEVATNPDLPLSKLEVSSRRAAQGLRRGGADEDNTENGGM